MRIILTVLLSLILANCGESESSKKEREAKEAHQALQLKKEEQVKKCLALPVPPQLAQAGWKPAPTWSLNNMVNNLAFADRWRDWNGAWDWHGKQGGPHCLYYKRALTHDHNSCRRQLYYTTASSSSVWSWSSSLYKKGDCDKLKAEYVKLGLEVQLVPSR